MPDIGATKYVLLAIGVLVALAGLIYAADSYTTKLVKDGFDKGYSEATVKFETRDNASLAAAMKRVKELEEIARGLEQKGAQDVAAAEALHQQEMANAKSETERKVGAARAGTFSLYGHGGCQAGNGTRLGNGSQAGTAAAGTGVGDDAARSKFSVEDTEFLLRITGEADEVARQLQEAQKILVVDRQICNAVNP